MYYMDCLVCQIPLHNYEKYYFMIMFSLSVLLKINHITYKETIHYILYPVPLVSGNSILKLNVNI